MISTVANSENTIAVTGSTGLVGKALLASLSDSDTKVKSIVRRQPVSYDEEVQWDATNGFVNTDLLEGLDAVVHLAGEPIAEGRWNEAKKRRIKDSRVVGTTTLCKALAGLTNKPKVLVSASAIGFYGNRGDEALTEDAAVGEGFLPDVCKEWEDATAIAADAGIRVVNLRIGVVIAKEGGALSAMLTPFRMGVGGRVGSGNQYWSWVSLEDLVSMVHHAIRTESLSGPVNAVSPNPVTNIEFTKALGRVLGRPTIFPMPGFMAKLVIGEMANDLLLSSAKVVPEKLQQSGFKFNHVDPGDAIRTALG